MKRILFLALLFAAATMHARAQAAPTNEVGYQGDPNQWEVPLQPVPTTSTQKIVHSVYLSYGTFVNTTASAITLTLVNAGTYCSSGPCTLWPAVSIAAYSTYQPDFHGIHMHGGVTWQASATGLNGSLQGRY